MRGFKSSDKYLPTEYCVVPVVSIIGRNDGIFSNTLWILGNTCSRANLANFGRILSYMLFISSPLL